MKMSDGQGASRVIRPDRRGPGALGDRRENVAALERAWRTVDTTAAFIAGEAALRRKHAVGRIQGGALHTRLDAHVRAPATARDLECAREVVRVLVERSEARRGGRGYGSAGEFGGALE